MAWTLWGKIEEACQEYGLTFGVAYNPEFKRWQAIFHEPDKTHPKDTMVRTYGGNIIRASSAAIQQVHHVVEQRKQSGPPPNGGPKLSRN